LTHSALDTPCQSNRPKLTMECTCSVMAG
jgi:hypothetical protein